MQTDFDVIVVGAGPGGSVAAAVAARYGLRTLLVNREGLPRDKACGDAVPEPAFLLLRELGMTDMFTDSAMEIDYVRFVAPAGAHLKLAIFAQSGEKTRIVSRFTFDHQIAQHAVNCGAEFKVLSVLEPLLEGKQVVGIRAKEGHATKDYHSKLVIGADGATSVIARKLIGRPRAEQHISISVRGYVDTCEALDATIELAFLRPLAPGYGWLFPMGKHRANIGVGLRLDIYKRQHLPLSDYLQVYRETPHIRKLVGDNKIEQLKSWQLPNCSVEQQRVFNGAILIGDAGGFVNPMSGAGIYPAMATGKYAAEAGAAAIHAGDLSANKLMAFEAWWRKELEAGMKYSALLQRIIAHVPRSVDMAVALAQIFPGIMRSLISKV